MSLVFLLSATSLVGAAAFFVAGFRFGAHRASTPRWSRPEKPDPDDPDRGGTADRLAQLLDRLRKKGVRAVVLADEQGLPIAGLGHETNSLAAFSGYVTEISQRMGSFAPFGTVTRFTLIDAEGGELCAYPHPVGRAGQVCLVTLTDGPRLRPDRALQVAKASAELVGKAPESPIL